jgi:hypothetical protein
MTALAHTTTPTTGAEPLELARYTVPEGERILIGRRVNGSAVVVDVPAGDTGRVYLVERDVQHDGRAALNAMIEDYVDQAERYGQIPMLATGLGRYLDARDPLS